MPRPILHKKSIAGKKAVATTGTTVTSKEVSKTITTATTNDEKSIPAGGRATRNVGRGGRVTRRGVAVERSLVEECDEREKEDTVVPVEEEREKEEEKEKEDAEVKKVGGRAMRTRAGGEVQVEVKERKKGGRRKKEVEVKVEVEVEVEDTKEMEETPTKGRTARSGRGKKTGDSVTADPELTPKAPGLDKEVVEREQVVEEEVIEEETEPENTKIKKPDRQPKSKALPQKAAVTKEGKGKGRATDEDDEIPSSPPLMPTQDSTFQNIPEQDDLSSTSSIYGDENFLPPPLASSTPKAGATATLPVTPPRPQFRSDEGYTPPPPTIPQPGAAAGPSTATSFSVGNLSTIRRRLWESSPTPSSPLSQCEIPKTATVVDEVPLGFDIYEDGSPARTPAVNASGSDPFSRLMDIDRDARGDGAQANILRTPKKKIPGFEPRKRTGTGTKKSPDGKIIEEEEEDEESSDDDSDISSSSDGEVTPKPAKPVVEAEPKRQKRSLRNGKDKEPPVQLTKDLLDLAPRRRKTARGPARLARNKEPVFDDLGEDLTSDHEDEISLVAKKRAAGKKGGRSMKDKGTTITKKATPAKATEKASFKGKNTAATVVETPKKKGRQNSISTSRAKSTVKKTYGRPKSSGDYGSDGSATPVPADKENDSTIGSEPSSELTGEDDAGLTKEGRRKLKEVKKAFEVVDEWEMEFEDISVEMSSEGPGA